MTDKQSFDLLREFTEDCNEKSDEIEKQNGAENKVFIPFSLYRENDRQREINIGQQLGHADAVRRHLNRPSLGTD